MIFSAGSGSSHRRARRWRPALTIESMTKQDKALTERTLPRRPTTPRCAPKAGGVDKVA